VNIYIYGNKKFRDKIYRTLEHGNIKFKIGDGVVEEVQSAEKMKELIEEDPQQVYLIDQNKIIYDDFLSRKLKFLQPKEGISQKFLDEYGMGDVTDKEASDLVFYIEKRIRAMEKLRPAVKAEDITSMDEMLQHYD
jgi:hypothetical protein